MSEETSRKTRENTSGKKHRFRYITARSRFCAIFSITGQVIIACLAFGICIHEEQPPVIPLIMLSFAGVCGALIFLFVYRPYKKCEDRLNRFLEGYLTPDIIGADSVLPSPETYAQIVKVNEVLNSAQTRKLNRRQAQYLALQNQINPHFLYNTLDSIRSEALIAGLDTVADMTEALATFFRYTISNTENLVVLEKEVENCRTYFKIQQYRFGERLSLEIKTDDDWEDLRYCLVPKITLQPILENSIIHGTELKVGDGVSVIEISRSEQRLLIRIYDNGVGMDEETLAKLNDKVQRGREGIITSAEKEKQGGIALVNVSNRIHLIFGEEYGLQIYSIKGIGTDVRISLPIVYNMEKYGKFEHQ